ncbi:MULTISPECIES: MCE family protein [unclassified Nocardia]|uniref:MCE family protein n=1 Tax=unclassified Nocardia TaxID=2637762 RepID=UPI001CE3D1D4|nr:MULTISPECIES: MCE family protein [unclassified Nocardia]
MTGILARFDGNRNLWIGLLGAVLLALMLAVPRGCQMLGAGEQSIQAEFAQAAGVRVGDEVDVAGVAVGRVSGLRLDGSFVTVTLQVDRDVRPGPDAKASIRLATLLGRRYVDLRPGDHSGLPGNRIPLSNTDVPYNLADVVQIGTPKFAALDTGKLVTTLNLLDQQFGSSPQLFAQALDSVGALAEVIDKRRGEVANLLQDLDRVTKILGENRNSVRLVITQGDAIAARVMEREGLLRQLLDNIATLTRQLRDIGADNDDQLGPTIDQLDTMTQGLRKNKENLDRLLSIMPPSVRYLANAWGNGNYAEVAFPWLFPDNWLCFANVIEGCR